MSTSLYSMSVSAYLQAFSGLKTVLKKAADYANENNQNPDDFIDLSLHESMWPLHAQFTAAVYQSVGAINGMKEGVFSPPGAQQKPDFAGLISKVEEAETQLKALTEEEVNALAGKPMLFKMGDIELPFTTENYVMSFSLPNFYFHVTTAYDILRKEGVPIGKADFLGQMRLGS